MKLILSSRDFMEDAPRRVILGNLPRPIGDCRVLFIPGEHATPENLKEDMYFRRMRQKGFQKGNIRVFDHTRPRDFFSLPLDVVYIGGCNTFLMLEKLRSTGFDKELVRLIRSGVTYIGGSAGAHVVSADVRHVVRYDPPPDGFSDFRGMGLYPGIFVCHFGKEREAHFLELQKTSPYPVCALTDRRSLVFEDGRATLYD